MKSNSYIEWHKKVFINRKEIGELLGIKNNNKLTEIMFKAEQMADNDGLIKPTRGKVYKKYILKMIGVEE